MAERFWVRRFRSWRDAGRPLAVVLTVWLTGGGWAAAGTGGGGGAVPEIGPNSLATALTVLIGGVLMLTGKRRRRK